KGQGKSQIEIEIERKLSLPITFDFQDQPLRYVLQDVRDVTGIDIVPDLAALEAESISLDRLITMHGESVSAKSALNRLLRPAQLTYIIKDEALLVTTESATRGKPTTRTYVVSDLVWRPENDRPFRQVDNGQKQQGLSEALIQFITSTIQPRTWSKEGGPGCIGNARLGGSVV